MRIRKQWARRGRLAVILGVALALAVPGSAWADDLRNDLDATHDTTLEVMNLTTSSGTSQIKVQPLSGDEESGPACNIDASESIVVGVSSTNTAVATVAPASLTYTNCNSQTVTVTPVGPGSTTIQFSITTNTTGSSLPNYANFTVNVSSPITDTDSDGVADDDDNCPLASNAAQSDVDGDSLGDACDSNSYAPAVSRAAADTNGNEGDTLTTSGAFSDQDGNNTLTITKVSGAGTVTDLGNGTWSWSHPTTDEGSGTVVVRASDGEHTAATDSYDWSAVNVPPSLTAASFGAAAACSVNGANNVSLTVTFTDPGSVDTHTADIDWNNDGTFEQTGVSITSGGSIGHSYASAGKHTANVRISDNDNGVSGTLSAVATVNYNLSSILQPVNDTRNGQPTSMFKYGSTVPVKVEITGCDGSHPSNLDVRVTYAKTSSNPPPVATDEAVATNTPDGGNQMRFSDPNYIFNFGTKYINDSSSTVRIDVSIPATGQYTYAHIGLKAK